MREMGVLTVEGGRKLFGSVRMPGAKNSVLPIMAAAVLCTGTVTITDAPVLSDVRACIRILNRIGCTVMLCGTNIRITPPEHPGSSIPPELMRSMRSSLFFLAPLLARTGQAEIGMPGGCRLGARPIDMHLEGLARMGAEITEKQEGGWMLKAPHGLKGAHITLRFPSVGATETLLMAACTAHGTTVLHGAAREPEVTDLAQFLQSAGAQISGVGTSELCIEGTEFLFGTQFAVCPDRITAATVMFAVAGCGGEVLLTNIRHADLHCCAQLLERAGCSIAPLGKSAAVIASSGRLRAPGSWQTGVYPAFPTDAAPLAAAALLRAQGESAVLDSIFENRFACAEGFCRMGAQASVSSRTLRLRGVPELCGAHVTAPDLRGGAALVLAALQAQGTSVITGTEHIDRGYENIAVLFSQLGGAVTAAEKQREGFEMAQ